MSKLTERDRLILRMILKGYTPTEIAEKAFLSPTGVYSARERIKQKLGAENTVELVMKGLTELFNEDHKNL